MQSNEVLRGSYLQIFDEGEIDTSIPGPLASFALSNHCSYVVPGLLQDQSTKFASVLVCGALNGLVSQKPPVTLNLAGSEETAEARLQRALQHVPADLLISRHTALQIDELNVQSVLCNTRVAYDMLLIAYCMSLAVAPEPGYGGALDTPVLTGFRFPDDSFFVSSLSRCAVRSFHILDALDFPVPYQRPSLDEIEVAQRIYDRAREHLTVPTVTTTYQKYTNDYLSDLPPATLTDQINLLMPLVLTQLSGCGDL